MIKPTALREAFDKYNIDFKTCSGGSWYSCPLRKLANAMGFDPLVSCPGFVVTDFLQAKEIIHTRFFKFTSAWDNTGDKELALAQYESVGAHE